MVLKELDLSSNEARETNAVVGVGWFLGGPFQQVKKIGKPDFLFDTLNLVSDGGFAAEEMLGWSFVGGKLVKIL